MLGALKDAGDFEAHLAEKRAEGRTLDVDALRLCFQASRGDREALEELGRSIDQSVDRAVARFGRDRSFSDEVKQHLREKLLTGERPRILEYAGIGDLGRWLRAVATRTAIDLTRAESREIADDDALANRAVLDEDPEIAHIKNAYASDFRIAFKDALTSLDEKTRNTLRLYYVQGLKLEELAALQKVVPSTVSRRLAQARGALLERTKQGLRDRLRVSNRDVESILRLIESRLELPYSALDEER
jgi:RNA polymerase sigma-70 factor (ECF subfamily)